MMSFCELAIGRVLRAWMALGAICLICAPGNGSAKTPDGMPPSVETVCSGLPGAAFGLCNAYCEAQDCDVHPRPSCPVLRKNFQKLTGSAVFPCDRRCGNGRIDRGEDCDPPGSACEDGDRCTSDCTCPAPICGNGTIDPGEECDPPGSPCDDDAGGALCRADCTCPTPVCGDGVVDPGEECDPPGSLCTTGVPCDATCSCVTEPTGCCECPTGTTAPMCQDGVTQSACLANGCHVGPAGSSCDPALGRCNMQARNCCQCPNGQCLNVASPDLCPTECTALPAPSMCDAAGTCQPAP
jgi:hypothetical protein